MRVFFTFYTDELKLRFHYPNVDILNLLPFTLATWMITEELVEFARSSTV